MAQLKIGIMYIYLDKIKYQEDMVLFFRYGKEVGHSYIDELSRSDISKIENFQKVN